MMELERIYKFILFTVFFTLTMSNSFCQDSVYVQRNEFGGIETISTYQDGKKNGWEYDFYEDGTIMLTRFFDNGVLDGVVTSYSFKNMKEKERVYDKGKSIKDRFFDMEGVLWLEILIFEDSNVHIRYDHSVIDTAVYKRKEN